MLLLAGVAAAAVVALIMSINVHAQNIVDAAPTAFTAVKQHVLGFSKTNPAVAAGQLATLQFHGREG
jgi:hypothetical protein